MAFIKLSMLCVFMFFTSLFIGLFPLTFNLSSQKLKSITTVGVGLLVGTAFIVIIPEGVHTYYSIENSHSHSRSSSESITNSITKSKLTANLIENEKTALGDPNQNEKIELPINRRFHLNSIDCNDEFKNCSNYRALSFLPGADNVTAIEQSNLMKNQNQIFRKLSEIEETSGTSQIFHQPNTRNSTLESEASHPSKDRSHSINAIASSPSKLHDDHSHTSSSCQSSNRSSSAIGASLALGFVMMLIVDRISGSHGHSHSTSTLKNESHHESPENSFNEQKSNSQIHFNNSTSDNYKMIISGKNKMGSEKPRRDSYPLNQNRPSQLLSNQISDLSTVNNRSLSFSGNNDHDELKLLINSRATNFVSKTPSMVSRTSNLSAIQQKLNLSQKFNHSATIGILVHSAIDGVALGAISVSENSSLELVVFLAIILHKGPAAFGLASFLLHQGRSKNEIKFHLTIFSLAAPITALLTYFILFQSKSLTGKVDSALLGLCLLFSGGTFLFTIAVHILPEISEKTKLMQFNTVQNNSKLINQNDLPIIEWKYIFCLIIGIFLPLLFSSGGHNH